MALTAEQQTLDSTALASLATHRGSRPLMEDLPTAYANIQAGSAPDSYYDHVNDRVYIRLKDPDTGAPLNEYKALDIIDPTPANRAFRTVEDPAE